MTDATDPTDPPRRPESTPAQARVRRGSAQMDMPRTPPPAPAEKNAPQDRQEHFGQPASNPDEGSSWADSALPAPRKKNARANPY